MEQYGGTVWKSMEQYGRIGEQCGAVLWKSGTVWRNDDTVWNSVEQCGGTLWNSMVEQ